MRLVVVPAAADGDDEREACAMRLRLRFHKRKAHCNVLILSRTRVTPYRPLRTGPEPPRLGERRRDPSSGPHRGRANGTGESSKAGEQAGRARNPYSAGRGASAGRVLIVDDEQAIRLICRLNLQTAGFETLEAADGAAALALARAEPPDLILLDIMLPEVDGWRVAEELSEKPETQEIPILFLSARSDRADEARGYELGGVGYMTKPFDPIELSRIVGMTLERARRGEREQMRSEWARSLQRER